MNKGKSPAQRDKSDKAYDRSHGIKQGSKRDLALDKKRGVYDYEYGGKKGKSKGRSNGAGLNYAPGYKGK